LHDAVGGLSVGVLSFGAVSAGLVAIGGIAAGVWPVFVSLRARRFNRLSFITLRVRLSRVWPFVSFPSVE
jgi:hypothetical protein